MAGWDVTVAVQGGSSGAIDDRPLRILGAGASAAAHVFKGHALSGGGAVVAESIEEGFVR